MAKRGAGLGVTGWERGAGVDGVRGYWWFGLLASSTDTSSPGGIVTSALGKWLIGTVGLGCHGGKVGNCAALVNLYSIGGGNWRHGASGGNISQGAKRGETGLRGQKGGEIGGGRERGYAIVAKAVETTSNAISSDCQWSHLSR